MSVAHLVRSPDDREQFVRRWVRLAWLRYQTASRFLANTPESRPAAVRNARQRVEAARVDFANAYEALGEELQ